MTQKLILDKDNPLATKVQTRDGRKARIICVDKRGPGPLIALVTHADGSEQLYAYEMSGAARPLCDGSYDLINAHVAPTEHRRWVNWYRGENDIYAGTALLSRAGADECASSARIACTEVVFKEGDGL